MNGWQPDQASHLPPQTRILTQSPLVNRAANAVSRPDWEWNSPHAVHSETVPVRYTSVYSSAPSSSTLYAAAPVTFHGAQSFSSPVSPPMSWMQVARAVSSQGRLGPATSLATPLWPPENATVHGEQVVSRRVFNADVETFRPSSNLSRSSFGGVQKTTTTPIFPNSLTGSETDPLRFPSYVQCAPLLGRLDQIVCASCGAQPSPPETYHPPRSAVADWKPADGKPYQPKIWGKSASEPSTISAPTSFIMLKRGAAGSSVPPRSGRAGPRWHSTAELTDFRPTPPQIICRASFEDYYPSGVKNLIKKFEGHSSKSCLLPVQPPPQRSRSHSDDCVTRTSASSTSALNTPAFADRFECPTTAESSHLLAVKTRGSSEVSSTQGVPDCASRHDFVIPLDCKSAGGSQGCGPRPVDENEAEDLVLHLGSSAGGVREEAKCLKLVFGAADLVSIKVDSAQTGTVHYHLNEAHTRKREFKITVTEEATSSIKANAPAPLQTVVLREAEEGPASPAYVPGILRGACHSSSFSGSSRKHGDDSLELVSDDGQEGEAREDVLPPLMNSRQFEANLCAPKRQGESVVEAIMRQDTLTLTNLASSPTAVGEGNLSAGEFSVSRDSKFGGEVLVEGAKAAGEDTGEEDSEVWYGGGFEAISSDEEIVATQRPAVCDERASPSPRGTGRKSEVVSSFRPPEGGERPRNLSVAAGLFNPAGVETTRILAAQEAAECARTKLDDKWFMGRYGLSGELRSGQPAPLVDEGRPVRDREAVDGEGPRNLRSSRRKPFLKRQADYATDEHAADHKTMDDLKELLKSDVRRCNRLAQFQRSITPLLRESMEKAWNQGMLSYVASASHDESSRKFHT